MWLDLRSLWEAISGSVSITIDVAGSITIAGQDVTAAVGVPVAPGSITFNGQSVTLNVGAPIANGSITFAGQSLTANENIALSTQGAITFQGQSVSTAAGTNVAIDTPGSITLAGQSVTAALNVALANGSITIDGQSISTAAGGSVNTAIDIPGSITFIGQQIAVSAPQGGGGLAPAGAPGSAGRKRYERKKYLVEIDGEDFYVASAGEAAGLLAQAQELAEERAQHEFDKALASTLKLPKLRRVIAHKLQAPVIRVPQAEIDPTAAAIERQARALQANIAQLYADIARSIEIGVLLRRQLDDDDEEAITVLLL